MTVIQHSILVVEDNKDLLNLFEINLSDQGYKIYTSEPHYIRTVWGVDYRFADKEESRQYA